MFRVNRSEGNKVADFKSSKILFSAQNPVDHPYSHFVSTTVQICMTTPI